MTTTVASPSAPITIARRLGYGIVAWAVPYAAALVLLPLSRTDPALFKTIEVAIGSLVGAAVTVVYFESITSRFLREGVIVGLVWMIENWLLDFAGVVPFARLTPVRYFAEIGLEYIAIFAMAVAVGYALERRSAGSTR